MKPILEEAVEQIKGQPKKPQAKSTQGATKQLDPGKVVTEALRQSLGFGKEKKIPTPEELSQMKEEERKKVEAEIGEITEDLGPEKEKKPKAKGNIDLIHPPAKPSQPEEPHEKEKEEERRKKTLPPLTEPTLKPKRGSFLEYIERKTKGAEIKGGRE